MFDVGADDDDGDDDDDDDGGGGDDDSDADDANDDNDNEYGYEFDYDDDIIQRRQYRNSKTNAATVPGFSAALFQITELPNVGSLGWTLSSISCLVKPILYEAIFNYLIWCVN